MAPIHLPPVGDSARRRQPSSNTGREEQRTRRKQCGHRWVRPCNSLTQARAPNQAQTSSHHTVATTESLPSSGLLPGPASTPTARAGWDVKERVPVGPPQSDAEELPGCRTVPGAFTYQIKYRPQRDAVRASHTLSAIDGKWNWGPSDGRDQSRKKPWKTQALLRWYLGSLVPQWGTKSS